MVGILDSMRGGGIEWWWSDGSRSIGESDWSARGPGRTDLGRRVRPKWVLGERELALVGQLSWMYRRQLPNLLTSLARRKDAVESARAED